MFNDAITLVVASNFSVELNFSDTENTMCLLDDELVKELQRFLVAFNFRVELNSEEINDNICCFQDEPIKE